jgi:uncharacterized cysteine cluster protein YcgN (CxxCxxCC family)
MVKQGVTNKSKIKVKCANCETFDPETRRCRLKQSRVSPNKNKFCNYFSLDKHKVKERHTIPSQRVMSWNLKKSEKQKKIKEMEIENVMRTVNPESITDDKEHPLTGDLSRFKTTGTDAAD